jgi:hypothetical protein
MSMVPHLMKSLSILRLSALASLITLAGSLGAEPIPAENGVRERFPILTQAVSSYA